MTEYSRQILDFFRSPEGRPQRTKELARLLLVPKKEQAAFKEAVEQLVAQGQLQRASNGLLRPRKAENLLQGTIRRTRTGGAYFTPADPTILGPGESLFIAASDVGTAFSRDEVLVEPISRRGMGGQRCGRVVEILTRATNAFVGTYHERKGQGYVLLDGGQIDEPIAVGDPGAKGAQPDDKVVIEMLRYPSAGEPGEGVLTKVLGQRGEPGVDLLSVIHQFELPDEFPEEVLEEARLQAQNFDEDNLQGRLDLTHDTIITIDPVDARDFDDAISLEKDAKGHWRLGVHIADVAHFVREGSVLDREAKLRGNSVYLPDKVIPMLPEVISNALASLQQGKVRFTKSAFIEFDPQGVPLHADFANSAIKVVKRFAYEQVKPILDDPEAHHATASAKVRALLARMHELAMILRRRRFVRGALEMDMPEVKLDFNKQGTVAGAHRTVHDVSHQIIEEFMLAANIAVAQALTKQGVPSLKRVHASPDEKKLALLAEFVKSLDLEIRPLPGRGDLQELLKSVKGESTEFAVSYAVLRSLKRAEYSPQDIGHYALAEDDYCHFTSPIRRYPDLTIHRLLNDVIAKRKPRGPNEADLLALGLQCSETERRAEQAERELVKIKLLSYLSSRIGLELEATVTGVETFGLFVMGIELPAEGLVHISSLRDDMYDYDKKSHTLTGRRHGTVFRLGDLVKVRVAAVNEQKRMLDFRLVEKETGIGSKKHPAGRKSHPPEAKAKPKRRPNTGPTKKGRKRR